MRKRDKAIEDIRDKGQMEEIIGQCSICHVGMVDGDRPYVLAFNFGYHDGAIYLHCAQEGKKLEVLRRNPKVCVEFNTGHELFARKARIACTWRWRYRSVLAHGKAELIEDYNRKVDALNVLMGNYTEMDFAYAKPAVNNVMIIRIAVEEMSGRQFEYHQEPKRDDSIETKK
jgi:hypothetical protein